jgi:ADP-ribosyl-[dinitrogen reductase] hydrolase
MSVQHLQLLSLTGAREDVDVETTGGPPYAVAFKSSAFGAVSTHGDDMIECLRQVRERIESAGWRLLCNGARRDAHASGMQRDMFGGAVLYLLQLGAEASSHDVVPTFEPAPESLVVNLAEQEAYHAAWLASLYRKGASGKRVVPLPTRSPSFSRARARGCLLGLAVGDALGTTLEFSRPAAPAFPRLATGPHRTVTGGGPFHVRPGQVTDDTEMAVCLADSIAKLRGLDVDDVRDAYRRWVSVAFDIGNQTRATLAPEAPTAADILRVSREHWVASSRRAAGNGSLMRTAPIGVALHSDSTRLREAALLDSAITHFDPRCRLACAALNESIAQAISSAGLADPAEMLDKARVTLSSSLVVVLRELDDPADIGAARKACDEIESDLDAARRDDPDLYGALHLHDTAGFVRVAFRLAYWELLHAPSLEAALIDVVNRGGDADTNGAITGALLGACFGEDAVPAQWSDAVLQSPVRMDHHPSHLLRFVDAI